MKIWWILAVLLVALLIFGVRERFEATQSIKAPPYDAAEKVRIYDMVRQRSATPPYTFVGYQDLVMAKAKSQAPDEKDETKLKEIAGGILAPTVEAFFTTVYKPAKTPIKQDDIDAFMKTRESDLSSVEKDVLTTYFIGQGGTGSTAYATVLGDMGQNYGYAKQSSTQAGTTSAGNTTPASNSSTGGSSTSSYGPNSGGSVGKGKGVFGPTFNGVGNGGNFNGDSTKHNQYPELLGGGDKNKGRKRESGSIGGLTGGTLTGGGLGNIEVGGGGRASRQPGDMDRIPDPYRVGQQFSTASYSFKTDPAPYLADFSAFLR